MSKGRGGSVHQTQTEKKGPRNTNKKIITAFNDEKYGQVKQQKKREKSAKLFLFAIVS